VHLYLQMAHRLHIVSGIRPCALFAVFNKVNNQAWLNHPAWYMKPIHVLLHLTGVEHICLGSSGNNGMAALENVIGYLKQGYSTL